MRAVDTNVLVLAENKTAPEHATALGLLQELAGGPTPWAIPWPCIYEFLRVVTHPRVFRPPMRMAVALEDLSRVLASPSLVLLHETHRHADLMRRTIEDAGVKGNLVHDAHIATLCIEHGVEALLTGDRDFRRFAGLNVIDPFH